MKRRVLLFVAAALFGIALVPAINLLFPPAHVKTPWYSREYLFNMGRWEWLASVPLSWLGVSTDPGQVIVGKDGWLYLGDKYESTVTVMRKGQSDSDANVSHRIGVANKAWEQWLAEHGVRAFRVMIGPDKSTIYPEHLPDWAAPASRSATDALLSHAHSTYLLDLRQVMRDAKPHHDAPLYYRTDTHWNTLGAGVAFRALAHDMQARAPELRWPADNAYALARVHGRRGGDLSAFLRATNHFHDIEPVLVMQEASFRVQQYDYQSGRLLHDGCKPPLIDTPTKPLLVKADGALNAKRVLWLRDSFGTSLSPFMSATFGEIVQLHWAEALKPGGSFQQIVQQWKPDYVFVTVVERSARSDLFAALPPLDVARPDGFTVTSRTGPPAAINDLTGTSAQQFKVIGGDPYIDFPLDTPATASETPLLGLTMNCADRSTTVPMQVFWLAEGDAYYSEKRSAKFAAIEGKQVIRLDTLEDWSQPLKIQRLRIDVESGTERCTVFTLHDIGLGRRH